MAGTLTISTLSDGTNSTSSTNCIKGSAKAWVTFTGVGSTSIQSSFNVSSVTFNGTGDYTINFTTAMLNATYAIATTGTITNGTNYGTFVEPLNLTTSNFELYVYSSRTGGYGTINASIVRAVVFSS